jgi:fibronectin type 3 domain-containing protein
VVHTVVLNWTASLTPAVTYRLFRSTISGGPYTALADGLTAPGYTDKTVQAGTTYYYVSTAVDVSNVESAYSNEAIAVVPVS